MNLKMLEALENSLSAILAIELKSEKIISENKRARELLSENQKDIDLSVLFFTKVNKNNVFNSMYSSLQHEDKYRIWETEVQGAGQIKIECDVEFSFVTDAKTHVFLKIRPFVDHKSFYLENFIETRKRPAFTMNRVGEYIIGIGNEKFYRAFACNKESIVTKYNSEFKQFLNQEGRSETLEEIRETMSKNSHGIIDVPIQTARGETLYLFYDTKKLRQVEKEAGTLVFCLLVSKTDTVEELTDPFDL